MTQKAARRIMAFDFGSRKIGVAIGQELSGTAQPLPPLTADNGIPDWDELAHRIEEWKPDAFVVGLPLNMDGSTSPMSIRADKFRKRLHGRFHRPSFSMDERLSSREARMLDANTGTHGVSLDSLSACLILESWFREQQTPSSNTPSGEHE